MTDRELLEAAAKAAGLMVSKGNRDPLGRVWADGKVWNPLTDDGDALRLAVKLSLEIYIDDGTATYVDEACSGIQQVIEPHNGDPYASTRRAIVRAAAEIGAAK
jgi:hypothetical protein